VFLFWLMRHDFPQPNAPAASRLFRLAFWAALLLPLLLGLVLVSLRRLAPEMAAAWQSAYYISLLPLPLLAALYGGAWVFRLNAVLLALVPLGQWLRLQDVGHAQTLYHLGLAAYPLFALLLLAYRARDPRLEAVGWLPWVLAALCCLLLYVKTYFQQEISNSLHSTLNLLFLLIGLHLYNRGALVISSMARVIAIMALYIAAPTLDRLLRIFG
jgi:hypothetical protein